MEEKLKLMKQMNDLLAVGLPTGYPEITEDVADKWIAKNGELYVGLQRAQMVGLNLEDLSEDFQVL